MEPISIAVIGTVIFGVVTSLSVFVRQLLLSRDKHLNDKAQERALQQENSTLEKMRLDMESSRRFNSHYKVLDTHKDDIQYLDQKIEELLEKKFTLIKRYSDLARQESHNLISGEKDSGGRKAVCDRLRQEVNHEIKFYDEQIEQMQARRASFWNSHTDLEAYLLSQERNRNQKLDELYMRHTGLLEKIYVRHSETTERIALSSINSGGDAFQYITAPLQMLLQFFHLTSTKVNPIQAGKEIIARRNVRDFERELNGYDGAQQQDQNAQDYDRYSEDYDDQTDRYSQNQIVEDEESYSY